MRSIMAGITWLDRRCDMYRGKGMDKAKKKCCLCGEKYVGWGNNAEPLAEGECCDMCNITRVIPARILNAEVKKAERGNKL